MEEPFADPAGMTPQQRRQEIAAILARGALRLRQNARLSHGSRPGSAVIPPRGLRMARRSSRDLGVDSAYYDHESTKTRKKSVSLTFISISCFRAFVIPFR